MLFSRLVSLLRATIISAAITFVLVEISLRLKPDVVPVFFLVQFNENIRAEIATRLNYPTQRTNKFILRDDGGPPLWVTMPGQVVTMTVDDRDAGSVKRVSMDWKGFCNPFDRNDRAYRVDIVTVGDSFSWCMGVGAEETWSSGIAEITNLGTYNLSRPAIGLHEDVQLLKMFGVEMGPRVVIMNFYEGNDLRDVLRFRAFADATLLVKTSPSQAERPPQAANLSQLGRLYFWILNGWMGRSSYAVNTLMTTVNHLYQRFKSDGAAEGKRRTQLSEIDFRYRLVFGSDEVAFNLDNADQDEVRSARKLIDDDSVLTLLDAPLESFADLAQRHAFLPVLAYSPSAHTAYAEQAQFADPALAPLLERFSNTQRAYLRRKAATLGLVFIDLTPTLRRSAAALGARDLLYFPVNLHYTQRGHSVVAEAITEALRRESVRRGITLFD
jgi:hypothetical protein